MELNNLCPHCLREIKNKENTKFCPYCGKDTTQMTEVQHQLKPFTILAGKYLVGDVLGEGGFGITYVGYDINLEMRVAVKEFYPNGFVTREASTTTAMTIYTGTNESSVQKWRDSFIKEARSLAKCSHLSGVVGVKDFFQENNTAYIILEYLEGTDLKNYVKQQGGKVPVDWLLKAMEPVVLALDEVHKQGIIHRDISPDNIRLLPDGKMKLMDFGAARDYTGSGEKSLSIMLKPGYAPEEQYRSKGVQGPWTDIYALAGTIYRCITGVTPPESMDRVRQDDLKKPSDLGVQIAPKTEAALMKAMAVYAEKRYQTISDFYRDLYAEPNGSAPIKKVTTGGGGKTTSSVTMPLTQGSSAGGFFSDKKKLGIVIGAAAAAIVVIIGIAAAVLHGRSSDSTEELAASAATEVVEEAAVAEVPEPEETVEEAENTADTADDAEGFPSLTEDDHICYLAIGNVITYWWPATLVDGTPVWWGTWGAAATTAENDYVHRVQRSLEGMFPGANVDVTKVNLYNWETAVDSTWAFPELDPYLNSDLDIISVQLGECIDEGESGPAKIMTIEAEFELLYEHIKEKAPNARIIVLGNVWSDPACDPLKQQACAATDIAYEGLDTIQDNPIYQVGRNATVMGDDGQIHRMTYADSATLPNDAGMKVIAQAVLDGLSYYEPTLAIPTL